VTRIRTQISVSGFTQREVESGLTDLLAEFNERPWLLVADVKWDDRRRRLVVSIEREGESLAVQGGDTGATLDEVWDCVIACFTHASHTIHFDVDATEFVPSA